MNKVVSDYKLFILNQKFETVYRISDYRSLLWIDRYNTPSSFELKIPFSPEFMEYAVLDNYIWFSKSSKLMIIEEIEILSDNQNEDACTIKGRSLESILDRRVIMADRSDTEISIDTLFSTLISENITNPGIEERKIENFVYAGTTDEAILEMKTACDYKMGSNLLNIVQEICSYHGIGFKIEFLEETEQFVMSLYNGVDRSYEQEKNAWVVYSRRLGNLIQYHTTTDSSNGSYRNTVYAKYGIQFMEFSNKKNLLRRELMVDVDDNASYTEVRQKALEAYIAASLVVNTETKVDAKIGSRYGIDFFVGDLVQMEQTALISSKARVTEYIYQINDRGVEEYPTFETPPDLSDITR